MGAAADHDGSLAKNCRNALHNVMQVSVSETLYTCSNLLSVALCLFNEAVLGGFIDQVARSRAAC